MAAWQLALASFLLFGTQVYALHGKRSISLTSAHALVPDSRLPSQITPTFYSVKLFPNLEAREFSGNVRITIQFQEPSDKIVLHAHKNLNIFETNVYLTSFSYDPKKWGNPNGKTKIHNVNVKHNPKEGTLSIQLDKAQKTGTIGEVEISFNSTMTSSPEGLFYQDYFTYDSKIKKTYMVTQFKPNYARRVFPCFDEPSYKAVFSFQIARKREDKIVFTMPIEKSSVMKDRAEWVLEKFYETPIMPTFALGFVIAEDVLVNEVKPDIDIMEKLKIEDTYISVISTLEHKEKLTVYANNLALIFSKVQEYWGVGYPLPKLQVVALPGLELSQPADNWGLILLRESDLTSKSSWILIQEVVYQWLGNYVTPFWWNDALTNAALGQFITAYIVSQEHSFDPNDNWPITMLYSIYYEYSRRYPDFRSGHMNRQASTGKTALVFRMLNYTLGSHVMQQALQKFMGEGAYKTFFADDIWKTITSEARFYNIFDESLSASDIAGSWMSKDRIPIIHVIRNYENNTVNITQKLFLRQRPHDVPEQDKYRWFLPIVAIHEENLNFTNSTPTVWMTPKQTSMILEDFGKSDKFVVVNPDEIGPFIVNYDEQNWNKLATFLTCNENREKIPSKTRAKLLHDAWNIAYAGDLNFGVALNMTIFLMQEKEYHAWDPMFTMVDHLGRHIDSFRVNKKFQAYVRILLSPMCNELGLEPVEGESENVAHLRTACRTFLCQVGYKPCIVQAQKQFDVWMSSPNPDEGNPVPNAYICPVFKWGSREEWEFGLERVLKFPESRRPSERTYLLKTLASCPNDGARIKKLLYTAILSKTSPFTDNDIYLILSMVGSSHAGYISLFEFLEDNFDALKQRFENSKNLWSTLISSATAAFKSRDDMEKVTKFYKQRENELGGAEIIVEKSMKNIREEAKWADENIPVIEQWLDHFFKRADVKIDDTGMPDY